VRLGGPFLSASSDIPAAKFHPASLYVAEQQYARAEPRHREAIEIFTETQGADGS